MEFTEPLMTSRVSAAFPTDFPQNSIPNPQDTANDYSGGKMKASISPASAPLSSNFKIGNRQSAIGNSPSPHLAFGNRHSALSPRPALSDRRESKGFTL